MSDVIVNSTGTVQMVSQFNGVNTVMDTVTLTVFNPNLNPVIGPITPTMVSTGVYQYAIPIGVLSLPGTWVHTWYVQKGAEADQASGSFTVGLLS